MKSTLNPHTQHRRMRHPKSPHNLLSVPPGSLEAHKRVLRVRDEFWRLVYGNGPGIPFKGNSNHSDIMELGLNLGLDRLTEEELADCFDEVCPCGKAHDADALKKHRARVRKQLERARYESLRAIPPRQRFAAWGAHGITARANQPARGIQFVEVSHHGNKPECLIYRDGTALITENSQFWGRDGLEHLTGAFGVEDPIELFSMFFPESRKTSIRARVDYHIGPLSLSEAISPFGRAGPQWGAVPGRVGAEKLRSFGCRMIPRAELGGGHVAPTFADRKHVGPIAKWWSSHLKGLARKSLCLRI